MPSYKTDYLPTFREKNIYTRASALPARHPNAMQTVLSFSSLLICSYPYRFGPVYAVR